MKKLLLIILIPFLFISCNENSVQSVLDKMEKDGFYVITYGDETLTIEWSSRSITYQDGKGEPITVYINEDAGRYVGIKNGNFQVSGAVMAETGVFTDISIGGKNIKQVPRWLGELNEDPLDGVSGDNYYNLSTNKERIFVKNNWQDRK